MSSQHPVNEKGLDDKAAVAFCESFLVLKYNKNLIIYNYKKYFCSVSVYFSNIWRLYNENILYDML